MSQPEWQSLVEKLRAEPTPRARRRVIAKLAATRDPAVIPFLRNAYLQDDDERVRDAAYEALAQFQAQRDGGSGPRIQRLQRALNAAAIVLLVVFVGSLAANGVVLITTDDDADSDFRKQTPSTRDVLVTALQGRLAEAQTLDAGLRGELAQYDQTGQPICPVPYSLPEPLQLASIDNYTYPDLRLVAANLDLTLPSFEAALVLLNSACSDPALQTQRILEAARKLDGVEAQLQEVDGLLRTAVERPAPTVGPSPTWRPTWTYTPTATRTPIPPTATVRATSTTAPSQTLAQGSTATPTLSASPAPSPTATLARPDLDYASILRQLARRYTVLGDLKNSYQTGMIDRWQQAQAEGQTSTSFCAISPWPETFELSDQERALFTAGSVADPELLDAVRLQQQGMALALEARALYDRDCVSLSLANSAREGIALAENAFDTLTRAQTLTNTIRSRP